MVLTVALHNEAPASGLPRDVLGSYPGRRLPTGTNRTWLSIYTPFGLAGATTLHGAPLSVSSTPELGVSAYSAYINVPAGDTVTLVLNLVGHVPAGANYTMAVRLQPMSTPDHDADGPGACWRHHGQGHRGWNGHGRRAVDTGAGPALRPPILVLAAVTTHHRLWSSRIIR